MTPPIETQGVSKVEAKGFARPSSRLSDAKRAVERVRDE
jgi:hypothetical protein